MPNITGSIRFAGAGQGREGYNAFSSSYSKQTDNGYGYGGLFAQEGLGVITYSFNARNGETKTDGSTKTASEHHVYGAANSVQPLNTTIKLWQRIS